MQRMEMRSQIPVVSTTIGRCFASRLQQQRRRQYRTVRPTAATTDTLRFRCFFGRTRRSWNRSGAQLQLHGQRQVAAPLVAPIAAAAAALTCRRTIEQTNTWRRYLCPAPSRICKPPLLLRVLIAPPPPAPALQVIVAGEVIVNSHV